MRPKSVKYAKVQISTEHVQNFCPEALHPPTTIFVKHLSTSILVLRPTYLSQLNRGFLSTNQPGSVALRGPSGSSRQQLLAESEPLFGLSAAERPRYPVIPPNNDELCRTK